ncbi:MAG: AsmA family protein [Burkholderiales bacterium]|nr:AsmA family protein [Burkholderiales bacterium]
MRYQQLVKLAVYISIGFILIFIFALVILTTCINPNDYKPLIVKALNNATAREVTIKGNISWVIIPEFGIKAENITIGNPSGFGYGNFMEANAITLSIDLLPLLNQNVIVNSFHINSLKLNLINKGNLNNWSLSSKNSTSTNNSDTKFKLQLNTFKLTNSQISYLNTTTNTHLNLNNLEVLVTSPTTEAISIDTNQNQLKLNNIELNINHSLKASINLFADLNKSQYIGDISIPEFSLNNFLDIYKLAHPPLANPQLLDKVALSSNFNVTSNSLDINNLNLQVGNSTLKGHLMAHSLMPFKAQESFTIDNLDLANYRNLNGFKLPMKNINSSGTLSFSHAFTHLSLLQDLTIQDITLLGFDANRLATQLNQISPDSIIHIDQANDIFKNIQAQIKQLGISKKRNLNQKTELGQLTARIKINNNILTTPIMKLDGLIISSRGHGLINLKNNKGINYEIDTQLHHKNPLLSYLTFPYIMKGTLNNINGQLDWGSIQQQIIKYYAGTLPGIGHAIARDTQNAAHKTGQFFKNLFK